MAKQNKNKDVAYEYNGDLFSEDFNDKEILSKKR